MAQGLAAWSHNYACSRPYHVGTVELAMALGTLFLSAS